MVKHITLDEIPNYTKIDKTNPRWLEHVVAFTRTPGEDGWDVVEYYGEKKIETLEDLIKKHYGA